MTKKEIQMLADLIFDRIVEKQEQMDEDDLGIYNFDMAELQWLKEEFTESEEINKTVS